MCWKPSGASSAPKWPSWTARATSPRSDSFQRARPALQQPLPPGRVELLNRRVQRSRFPMRRRPLFCLAQKAATLARVARFGIRWAVCPPSGTQARQRATCAQRAQRKSAGALLPPTLVNLPGCYLASRMFAATCTSPLSVMRKRSMTGLSLESYRAVKGSVHNSVRPGQVS